mgnify:CR=1 FL=1
MKDIIKYEELNLEELGAIGDVRGYKGARKLQEFLNGRIAEFEEKIKEEASERFEKNDKLTKAEVNGVSVTRVRRGNKVAVVPLEELWNGGSEMVILDYKMDTARVNEYKKQHGELPEGFVEVVSEYLKLSVPENED